MRVWRFTSSHLKLRERAGKFNCELRQRALFSWHLGVRLLGVDYVSHNVASRVAGALPIRRGPCTDCIDP
jgi:hypothetical protein